MITIFGIKNCDTMKKTFAWFNDNNVAYEFQDYKKQPPSKAFANSLLAQHSWDTVINKRGTTWRKLDDETKANMNDSNAIELMQQQPSIIKRPIIESNGQYFVGFDVKQFKKLT